MSARRKLTDKQRKQVIARYIEVQNYRQVAREYNMAESSIRRIVKDMPEAARLCAEKKEENTLDMIKYMEGQKGAIQNLLSNIIIAMDDPEKLKRTNPRDLATAYGIIWDKITQTNPKANDEMLQRAREILGGINGVIS